MLEIVNLCKSYSTKGGVTVKALDNVSVQFPETGMVFLLGRSGSGKSTLLNVAGGLDKPDSGEIIVKGKSSKNFSSADFDSYRNTYVGFVFQEYNILNEFTIEQNIALALQLQNKPNNKKAVNELLEQVDLKGFGKRKPNTLSGGQKQRVAIARALIKEPEIIMADEPTGALDSNTGKQVFDTLKKLSETKLVVVVSHDREFAEQYGDRIIELKDGQILSDVSKAYSEPKDLNSNVRLISEDTISIKNAEEVTEADVKSILSILKKNQGEAIITANKRELNDVKRACKINDNGNKEFFKDTDNVEVKQYDGKKTKFIKSRLPASHAFKMGASGLKTKPIRLIFTILLSIVAFVMFGVVSTFMLYDANYSVSEALKTANYPSLTVEKYYTTIQQSIKVDNATGEQEVDYEYENDYKTLFGVQELKDKNAQGNGNFAGIYDLTNDRYGQESNMTLSIKKGESFNNPSVKSDLANYYPVTNIRGFTDCGESYMTQNNFQLLKGKYPKNDSEIAISEYMANVFVNSEGLDFDKAEDLVGKTVKISGCQAIGSETEFKIVGVYKVGEIDVKYDPLKNNDETISSKEKEDLRKSLTDYLDYSFNTIAYVSEDFYDRFKDNIQSNNYSDLYSEYFAGIWLREYDISNETITEDFGDSFYTTRTYQNNKNSFKFYDKSGAEIEFNADNFKKDQVFVSVNKYEMAVSNAISSCVSTLINELSNDYKLVDGAEEALGQNSNFREDYMNGALDDEQSMEMINEYYDKLFYHKYVLDAASQLIGKGNLEILTSYNNIYNYVHSADSDAVKPATWSDDWTAIKSAVDNNYSTTCEQQYYAYFAKRLYNSYLGAGKNVETINEYVGGDDFYNIAHEIYYNIGQLEKFDGLKAAVDALDQQYLGCDVSSGKAEVHWFTPIMTVNGFDFINYKNYNNQSGKLTVVGYYDADSSYLPDFFVNQEFMDEYASKMNKYESEFTWISKEISDYVAPTDAKYNYLISLTNNTQEEIATALSSSAGTTIKIKNEVYSQLDLFLSMITEMEQIFLIIGIVFGVFSGLMLLNFISVSISAKKKDIGILRAVGARGSDVFKIFFAEAFIIAVICFVLATVGAYVVCDVLNSSLVSLVSMKLLNFELINVGLILAVSFGISIIATFFPVYFAAKKSPVESIRAL